MDELNQQLVKIFDLIDYQTRFRLKMSSHAVDRMKERISITDAPRLGTLIRRIVNVGGCELLYYQTRYANGEKIELAEFVNGNIIVPFTCVGDYVVLRTIMFEGDDREVGKYAKIDLSDNKFK